MPSYLTSALLLALSTFATASPVSPPQLFPRAVRTGKVYLHKSINDNSLTLGTRVGCLDVNGRLILESSACASYTQGDVALNIAHTSAGECGFHWANEPKNPDQTGTIDWSAFRCKSEGTGTHDYPDQFGLLDSGDLTYVVTVAGSGANYMVFTKALPKSNGEAIDVFTRAWDLGEGSINMLWVFEDL